MTLATVRSTSINTVYNSIGINTHIDFKGYSNLSGVITGLKYLGVKNIRDSANSLSDLGPKGLWQKVADATGAKFDDFMAEGSPTTAINDLGFAKQLAAQGILNFIENANENDSAWASAQGNSIAWTANFQKQVYAVGHSLGLPVINMSFGFGWTAANNWQGNYDKVGDLSPYTDYGNAHTYPSVGNKPGKTMQLVNSYAKLAAKSRPVITTEIGYDVSKFTQAGAARFVLDTIFDGIKNGDAKTYLYALLDDSSGQWGLMNKDGTPRPAGTAVHNLTTILADTGPARTDSLTYGLTGTTAQDNSLLMERSNGTFDLALWNEVDGAHNVTLTLGSVAQTVKIFDPMSGTSAIGTYSNTSSVTIAVPDHPIIVEINPSGTPASSPVVTPPAATPPVVGATNTVVVTKPATLAVGMDTITGTETDPTQPVYLNWQTYGVPAASSSNWVRAAVDPTTGSFSAGVNIDHAGTSSTLYYRAGSGPVTAAFSATPSASAATTTPPPATASAVPASAGATASHVIKIGPGTQTVSFAGSDNTIYVGSGNDTITDSGSGSNNTIVFGKAGTGTAQIYGFTLTAGDKLDLRTTLANTSWTGDPAKLGNFLQVGVSQNNAVISVDPSGAPNGATYQLAVLHGSGPLSLATLLNHSTTV